jgi:hypothetical protein
VFSKDEVIKLFIGIVGMPYKCLLKDKQSHGPETV